MQEINFNEEKLINDEIDKIVRKVRAFVVDLETNKVLLVNYAGLYMLPGGSIDNKETEIEALKREILEEAGIIIDNEEIIPFLVINSYDKNYFDRKKGIINRLTQTIFFKVVTDKKIDVTKKELSESEKEKNHITDYIDISDITSKIENNTSDNPKRKQFDRELLTALDVFLKIQNQTKQLTLGKKV